MISSQDPGVEIPNAKTQIPNKSQTRISKKENRTVEISIGYWVWHLGIGAAFLWRLELWPL